jgi:hypothetical protein
MGNFEFRADDDDRGLLSALQTLDRVEEVDIKPCSLSIVRSRRCARCGVITAVESALCSAGAAAMTSLMISPSTALLCRELRSE